VGQLNWRDRFMWTTALSAVKLLLRRKNDTPTATLTDSPLIGDSAGTRTQNQWIKSWVEERPLGSTVIQKQP